MKRWLVLFTALCGAAGASQPAPATGAAPADPMQARAAACVAALKARAEPLAQRVRRGDTAAEASLLPIVTASFAFIGTVYKQGLRSPQADDMLRKAEAAQAKLPPAELGKLQDACQIEGQQLYAHANFFERQFVSHAAQRRIAKLRKHAAAKASAAGTAH